MFDANMRYLEKGTKFKAKVEFCKPESQFYPLGIRKGDTLICEMLDETHKNPRVEFTIQMFKHILKADRYSWISFEEVIE